MAADVDWPNAWEGGRIHGREGVREYWTRQWAEIDAALAPVAFTARPDGTVAVVVEQVTRDLEGAPLGEQRVVHVYAFRAGLIARMDVEKPDDQRPRKGA